MDDQRKSPEYIDLNVMAAVWIVFLSQATVGTMIEILFYLPNREKVKQVEMSEKASLTLQAKDEELLALKLVSIMILLRI